MSFITLATSSLATISTVVCIYLKGKEISAEGTPPLENAKESVSVPVALLSAFLWKGIFFFLAVSVIKSLII